MLRIEAYHVLLLLGCWKGGVLIKAYNTISSEAQSLESLPFFLLSDMASPRIDYWRGKKYLILHSKHASNHIIIQSSRQSTGHTCRNPRRSSTLQLGSRRLASSGLLAAPAHAISAVLSGISRRAWFADASSDLCFAHLLALGLDTFLQRHVFGYRAWDVRG